MQGRYSKRWFMPCNNATRIIHGSVVVSTASCLLYLRKASCAHSTRAITDSFSRSHAKCQALTGTHNASRQMQNWVSQYTKKLSQCTLEFRALMCCEFVVPSPKPQTFKRAGSWRRRRELGRWELGRWNLCQEAIWTLFSRWIVQAFHLLHNQVCTCTVLGRPTISLLRLVLCNN